MTWKMSGDTTSESTICGICGQLIRWSSNDVMDDEFDSVIEKLIHHHKTDLSCKREVTLNKIFDIETTDPVYNNWTLKNK
jgi:hypothetical protein